MAQTGLVLGFQPSQSFIVAAPFEVVRQRWIDGAGELPLKGYDPLGNGLQLVKMCSGVALVALAVADDAETFTQGVNERLVRRVGVHGGSGLIHEATR